MDRQIEGLSKDEQAILNIIPGGVMLCENDGVCTINYVGNGFVKTLGYSREEIKKLFDNQFVNMVRKADREMFVSRLTRQMKTGERQRLKFRVACKNVGYLRVYCVVRAYLDDGCQRLFCTIRSSEENEINQDKMRFSLEPLQLMMDKTNDLLYEWDRETGTVVFSENWYDKLGYEPYLPHAVSNEIIYKGFRPEDKAQIKKFLKSVKSGVPGATAEARIIKADGGFFWCRMTCANQYNQEGRPIRTVGTISDIDEEKNAIEELRRKAELDALTGLYNHVELQQRSAAYLNERPESLCALFMIDIDNFKGVNDGQGHLFGDAVLSELANAMKKLTRRTDILGRIGGDEFAMFLKDIPSPEVAEEKARQLLEVVKTMFEHTKGGVDVTCSIGFAIYPRDGLDFTTLYHCADLALYKSKSQGKNRFFQYNRAFMAVDDRIEYSPLGTEIDSNTNINSQSDALVNYVFQTLYYARNIDSAINAILEIVGRRFEVSRAYVFETSEDGAVYDNSYEWCNDGIEPQQDKLRNYPLSNVEYYRELFGDDGVFYCQDINSLPPKLKSLFDGQNIKSTLQCACMDQDDFRGFVGFDECTGVRMWTKDESDILTLVAQIITTFLLKKREEDANAEMLKSLSVILDTQEAYIYAVEENTYELLYMNRRTRHLDPTARLGNTCYNAFYNRDEPCENCALNGSTDFYNPKYNSWLKTSFSPMRFFHRDANLVTCYDVSEYKSGLIPGTDIAGDISLGERRKILVIEDNEINRSLLCGMLNPYYDTIEAENGREGLRLLEENGDKIALIMLDIIMPVMNGYEFLAAMKAGKYAGIPVIVTTQNSGEEDEVAALSYGVSDFVAKPYKPQIILHRVANIINLRETASIINEYKFDNLTGLYTKDYFCRLAREIMRANPDKKYDILSVDIDNFKLINDILGKDMGDDVLRSIGRLAKENIRDGKIIIASRINADRFVCLMERLPRGTFTNDYFSALCSRINRGANCKNIQLSWGIYSVMDKGVSIEQMCDWAFMAASSVKGQYKKYFAYYEESFRDEMLREKEIVDVMEEALEGGQFEIYLQPKYSIKDGHLTGAETLVRWNHPQWGLQPPAVFIPLFEKNGFITELDRYVWEKSCIEIRRWLDKGYDVVPVSVNVSRVDIYNTELTEVLTELIKKYNIDPALLHLEITESAYAENPRQIIDSVTNLRELGFTIEMDDFGSGYSTLNMLREMPVDILKLDMKFIQNENVTKVDREMIRFVINLARLMDLGVVAEGVETAEQLERLRELGCDSAQGYYFAKPMPTREFEKLIIQED